MRGQREGPPIIPVGTLISLASLDSFPLEGGSHYGAHTVRPYESTRSGPMGTSAPAGNANM